MSLILTIEDEEHLQELLQYSLKKEGYQVLPAMSAEEGLLLWREQAPDLILLDYMLPGENGLQFLQKLRSDPLGREVPVIMLTAKNEELDIVRGFESGADDYVGKPFRTSELLARVAALLRRSARKQETEKADELVIGQLAIDFSGHEVRRAGKKVELSHKEFALLALLVKNKGKVMPRELLLEKIWGYDYFGETRTVDVHVRNLRMKLEDDDREPKYLQTVRGVGYKFVW